MLETLLFVLQQLLMSCVGVDKLFAILDFAFIFRGLVACGIHISEMHDCT